jgi:hypothetical protein
MIALGSKFPVPRRRLPYLPLKRGSGQSYSQQKRPKNFLLFETVWLADFSNVEQTGLWLGEMSAMAAMTPRQGGVG